MDQHYESRFESFEVTTDGGVVLITKDWELLEVLIPDLLQAGFAFEVIRNKTTREYRLWCEVAGEALLYNRYIRSN